MAKLTSTKALISFSARRRFSKPSHFGFSVYAFSNFGDEFSGLFSEVYGNSFFGFSAYGGFFLLSGIYQSRMCREGQMPIRMRFYQPGNPRSELQQANRDKLSSAVLAWQGLTNEQKLVYRNRAIRESLSGYNLFLREHMLSS